MGYYIRIIIRNYFCTMAKVSVAKRTLRRPSCWLWEIMGSKWMGDVCGGGMWRVVSGEW